MSAFSHKRTRAPGSYGGLPQRAVRNRIDTDDPFNYQTMTYFGLRDFKARMYLR